MKNKRNSLLSSRQFENRVIRSRFPQLIKKDSKYFILVKSSEDLSLDRILI